MEEKRIKKGTQRKELCNWKTETRKKKYETKWQKITKIPANEMKRFLASHFGWFGWNIYIYICYCCYFYFVFISFHLFEVFWLVQLNRLSISNNSMNLLNFLIILTMKPSITLPFKLIRKYFLIGTKYIFVCTHYSWNFLSFSCYIYLWFWLIFWQFYFSVNVFCSRCTE